jgi:outer membrane protein OmpA-like peptidoglycan-associated protein
VIFSVIKPKQRTTMIHLQKLTKPLAVLLILSMTLFSGVSKASNAESGAGIGAAAGGILGGIIGSQSGSWVKGAIIGGIIGGAAGALIGDYMDKQAEEIEKDVNGVKVVREGDAIRVTFDSGILFPTGSADLSNENYANIEKLAGILNRYHDTSVVVEGHTDNTGTQEENQYLSEERAEAVTKTLVYYGVDSSRITPYGYGDTRPVASNDSEWGRSMNRRVEILIYANEELKRQAESGRITN